VGKTIINNQHLGMVYTNKKNGDDWGPLGDGKVYGMYHHLPSFTHIAALQGRSVAFPVAPHGPRSCELGLDENAAAFV